MPARLAIAMLLLAAAGASARATERRFAVVIGANTGSSAGRALRFAEQDARKVRDLLVELGGFRADDVTLLLQPRADAVRAALRQVRERLVAVPKPTRTLLLVYYSGHATRDVLELGDTRFGYPELSDFVRTAPADLRLALLDACHSGELATTKGGRRGPAFTIEASEPPAASGYAIIASSTADELSEESDELRGAVFTHFLLSALRGAADEPADGRVSLAEAYRYAFTRTVAWSSGTIGGVQHPTYAYKLAGCGDVVLTVTSRSRASVTLKGILPGRLLVLDGEGRTMIAEASVSAERPAHVALPPGRYALYLLQDGRVLGTTVTVSDGDHETVWSYQLTEKARSLVLSKGAGDEPAPLARLGIAALMSRFPLSGQALAYGAELSASLDLAGGWRPDLHLAWTTAPDAGTSTGYQQLGVLAGVSYAFGARALVPLAWLRAGYEVLWQDPTADGDRISSAFAWLAGAGVEWSLGSVALALDAGGGGRVLRLRSSGWTHRWDARVTLGVAFLLPD